MPPRDIDKLRIAPRRPDGDHVAQREDHHPGDPQPEAKPDRGRQRRIGDRQPARRAAEQDMFGLSIAFAASSFFLSFFSFGGGALV